MCRALHCNEVPSQAWGFLSNEGSSEAAGAAGSIFAGLERSCWRCHALASTLTLALDLATAKVLKPAGQTKTILRTGQCGHRALSLHCQALPAWLLRSQLAEAAGSSELKRAFRAAAILRPGLAGQLRAALGGLEGTR